MNSLSVWLQSELHGKKLRSFIFYAIIIQFLYTVTCIFIIHFMSSPQNVPESEYNVFGEISLVYAPLFFFFAAMFEEILFRAIPLFFATQIILILTFHKKDNNLIGFIWYVVIVVSSFLFGVMHLNASSLVTLTSVLCIQGALGVLYCVVYLKCGGGNMAKRISAWHKGLRHGMKTDFLQTNKALLCSTFVHCCHNLILFYIYRLA